MTRYFEVSLFLLITTGFLTLASTGKLDTLSLIFVTAVLLARGVLLLRGKMVTIPVRWTNAVTLAYAAFYLIDFFVISNSFVTATVHLVLFSMAVKIFSVQRERDRVYLALLAFLMVLSAAILTVETSFLFLFALFLLLAIATFVAQELKRSLDSAKTLARTSEASAQLPGWLSALAVALMMGILLLGTVLFFALPRRTGGYLSSLAESNQFVSGFSNEVELGNIGEIKRSSAVVMHIQVENDARGAYTDLKWRGLALSYFDGRRWSRSPFARYALRRNANGNFYAADVHGRHQDFNALCAATLQGAQAGLENPSACELRPGARWLSYRVLMEPIGTDVFFVAPYAAWISGKYRIIGGDDAGALFSGEGPIGAYNAISDIRESEEKELRQAAGEIPADVKFFYLQLPAIDPRVTRLAEDITAKQSTDYDKALAIQNYLGTHYGYTLQLPSTLPADPIANFLFERKQGHCEYFASAMAIMLRTIGIPSRLVNGFRGAEFNDLNSTYIVRASSAHTWVEAYLPGYGWATFDPTPPDPKAAATRWSRLALYMDAFSEFWQEWVINYDFAHQVTLHNQALAGWQRASAQWQAQLLKRYRRLVHNAQNADFGMKRRTALELVLILLALIFAINSRRLWRAWRRRQIAGKPQEAPRAAATIWYERMEAELARRGCERKPSQTPNEFAASVANPMLQRSVKNFTEHYESARFGDSAEDAEKLPQIYDEIAMLK